MIIRKYKNPPIQEAILTIKLFAEMDLDLIEKCCSILGIGDIYQYKKPNILINSGTNNKIVGYLLSKTENFDKTVLRINGDIISLHYVNMYSTWEIFTSEFRSIYEALKNVYVHLVIQNIETRFINNIPIPKNGHLNNYTKLIPLPVDGLSNELSGFLVKFNFAEDENFLASEIIQTLSLNTFKEASLGLILDIKAKAKVENDFQETDFDTILESLRKTKNNIFFSVITEQTEKILEEL